MLIFTTAMVTHYDYLLQVVEKVVGCTGVVEMRPGDAVVVIRPIPPSFEKRKRLITSTC